MTQQLGVADEKDGDGDRDGDDFDDDLTFRKCRDSLAFS
jgi:hypothetical protein